MKSTFQTHVSWSSNDEVVAFRGFKNNSRNAFGFPDFEEHDAYPHECQDYDEVEYYHSIKESHS